MGTRKSLSAPQMVTQLRDDANLARYIDQNTVLASFWESVADKIEALQLTIIQKHEHCPNCEHPIMPVESNG